ncbi:MAG TPA: DUF1622 domain-containing protein [Pyrinomonadaceae bacterium]|jgi:uncharacterized membrane protein
MLHVLQEGAQGLIRPPGEVGVEPSIVNLVLWLKLAVETVGAVIIGLGVFTSLYRFARALVPPQFERYNEIRLSLARYLALALEFQLGADILSTAIAPSWEQIGKLGAIAVIRTGLNYFLSLEMKQERRGAAGRAEVEGGNDEGA